MASSDIRLSTFAIVVDGIVLGLGDTPEAARLNALECLAEGEWEAPIAGDVYELPDAIVRDAIDKGQCDWREIEYWHKDHVRKVAEVTLVE